MNGKEFNLGEEIGAIKQKNEAIFNYLQEHRKAFELLAQKMADKNILCAARSVEHKEYGENIKELKENIDRIEHSKVGSIATSIVAICVAVTTALIVSYLRGK